MLPVGMVAGRKGAHHKPDDSEDDERGQDKYEPSGVHRRGSGW